MRTIYRDGLEQTLDGPVKVRTTSAGHVVESWKSNGKRVYFATIKGTTYCAHGDTEAQAISGALWKDESKRPSLAALRAKIKARIKTYRISLMEFRTLTGACQSGCYAWLEQHGLKRSVRMTLAEFKKVGGSWADTLERVLNE